MTDKVFISKRKWLNPKGHDDTGAISCHVSCDKYGYVESDLSIWDCGKKIGLNFSIYNDYDAKQRAVKLDILIGMLQDMKAALGECYEYQCKVNEEEDD